LEKPQLFEAYQKANSNKGVRVSFARQDDRPGAFNEQLTWAV
jgi:hypothetical protein